MDTTTDTLSADRMRTFDGCAEVDTPTGNGLFDLPEEIIDMIIDTAADSDGARIIMCMVCKRMYARAYHHELLWSSVGFYAAKTNSTSIIEQFGLVDMLVNNNRYYTAAKSGSLDVIKMITGMLSGISLKTIRYIAARSDHLDVIKYIDGIDPTTYTPEESIRASDRGHLHILEWEHSMGYNPQWTINVINVAAANGHIALVKWLVEHGCPYDGQTFEAALLHGHIDVYSYGLSLTGAIENKISNATFSKIVALNGHLEVMRKFTYRIDWGMASKYAAQGGHVHIIDWLKEIGRFHAWYAFRGAVRGGYIEIVRGLDLPSTERRGIHVNTTSELIYDGHVDMLEYLWSEGYRIPHNIMTVAAEYDQLGVLKWAESIGFPITNDACYMAAANGDTDILQWMFTKGFPKHAKICARAAGAGQLNTVVWLREQGCPWDESVCAHAAGCNLRVLKWLRKMSCPWDAETCTEAYGQATKDWIHANGCPCEHTVITKSTIGSIFAV